MDITIDNRVVEAKDGETVLQVALRHGIEIPHFCYHPCLSIAGNCRMCLVKLEGVSKLMPSCNLGVAANMKVETAAPEVVRARGMVMQFLMQNHPVDCGICDKAGECRLQDYQFAFGLPRSRSSEPKHHKRKLYDLTPRIQLDNERCILCSRCVRFTSEISGSNLLGIVDRGGHAYVDGLSDPAVNDPYSDNVIGLCPTGALLSRDFLYQSRVWFLEPIRSVCTGCARGCSVDLWRRKKEWELRAPGEDRNRVIYRVTAADNPQINGPWICNKGFDLHKTMHRPRALAPAIAGVPATLAEVIHAAKQLLAQAQRPAALVSAQASNEELDAFQAALGSRLRIYTREDCAPAPGEVLEDALLIKADKNPNTFGVRQRFGSDAFDAGAGNEHDLFLVWGEWTDFANLGNAKLVHLTPYADPAAGTPDVLIPISTTFERSGTFSNFEGTTNHFHAVFDKPPLVEHADTIFPRLGS
jgi:NADH-quinone oxidoreductase subunit G